MRREVPQFDIAPILEYYGADLGRVNRSSWSKIRCPFHDDTNASASVNLSLNRFSCHAFCLDRQTEDSLGLIRFVEQCSYQDAIQKAESISGESHRPVRGKHQPKRSSLLSGSWD